MAIVCMAIYIIFLLECCLACCAIYLVLLFHVLFQGVVVTKRNRAGIAPILVVHLLNINNYLL